MRFKPANETAKSKPPNPQKTGKQPAYTIRGEAFFSKTALGNRVVWISEKNMYGKLQGDEGAFVREYLNIHPSAATKIGCGVAFISVVPNRRKINSWSLVITRTDGSAVDFSYRECLWPSDARKKALSAFRDEIFYQRQEFIEAHVAQHGNPAGVPLIAHHDPSFESLVESFIRTLPCRLMFQWEDLETYEPDNTETSCGESRFVDKTFAEAWRAYHKTHAKFHAVTEEEHKKIHGKENDR